eukprot:CAMPEP_0116926880 /NCGR_PEP_ID=MMETSP0467-20121206/24999_1 /TAXON_ID=283647 /ORGANISM="Mesodinium pulex, Strain SPMC105" /LENGTH=82 /DNA_ID=CAMNT_0004606243 /DNA_START=834 /DNA_END=1082 /DNA_ORIENTATION=+
MGELNVVLEQIEKQIVLKEAFDLVVLATLNEDFHSAFTTNSTEKNFEQTKKDERNERKGKDLYDMLYNNLRKAIPSNQGKEQ